MVKSPIPRHLSIAAFCGFACLCLAGCHTVMHTPRGVVTGNYGAARMKLVAHLTTDKSSRAYLLDRMRVGIVTLEDGYPRSAQHYFAPLYNLLRTQGINKDRTVESVVLYEGVKIWKGEPFEQALAMMYYGLDQAEQNSWDNCRAAMHNSLFDLRDFGDKPDGTQIDTYQIARRSILYEKSINAGDTPAEAKKKADYLDHGYVVDPSDFTLGYLLNAVANQQLGRAEEASDNFNRVLDLKPGLAELVEAFKRKQFNTVLVVSWGLGPEKVGYGPDDALGKFVPRDASDGARLYVGVDTQGQQSYRRYPQVEDVNTMAASHLWRSLADIRVAKSALGTGLLIGGAIATNIGLNDHNNAALYGGLGAIAVGALMKVSAHVDTRYCDVMPQRFYVLPLMVTSADEKITLQVDGKPGSRLMLTGLGPPEAGRVQLRYVALVSAPESAVISASRAVPGPGSADSPARWATSGKIYYTSAAAAATVGPTNLPYILGGRDIRPPSDATLRQYQDAGYLRNFTTAALSNLFYAEGLKFTVEDQGGYAGRNILVGGNSLVSPLPGTTGFTYLFGQPWPAYQAKSDELKAIRRSLK